MGDDDTPSRSFGDGYALGWDHCVQRMRAALVRELLSHGWRLRDVLVLVDRAVMSANRAGPIGGE